MPVSDSAAGSAAAPNPATSPVPTPDAPLQVSAQRTAASTAVDANDSVMLAPVAVVSLTEQLGLSLTTQQRKAIEQLTSGRTLVESATAAGVSRMTLYRWLKGDAVFQAAFNAWQNDLLDTARARVLSLTDLAVTTVARSMGRGDGKTALRILERVGVLDRAQPGSTDATEIARQQKLTQKRAEIAARSEARQVMMEDSLTL